MRWKREGERWNGKVKEEKQKIETEKKNEKKEIGK